MNRALSLLFLFMSFCLVHAQDIQIGDMNGDNKLSITDVTILVDAIVNKTETRHVYSAEDFIKENALTGVYKINGKEQRYVNGELDPYNGREYVDLGLSVKWATMNVGASTTYGNGKCYAWGETAGKDEYMLNGYQLCNGTSNTMNRYCTDSDYGVVDNKTVLSEADDAASVIWGGRWRMPSNEEFEELLSNCYCVHTTDYNGSYVDGYIIYKVKSDLDRGVVDTKKSSETYTLADAHIFLPASGFEKNMPYGAGVRGYYWTSSLYADAPDNAYNIYFYPGEIYMSYFSRFCGLPIRAVCP